MTADAPPPPPPDAMPVDAMPALLPSLAPDFASLSDNERAYISWACDRPGNGIVYEETAIASTDGAVVERCIRMYNRCFGMHIASPVADNNAAETVIHSEIVSLVRERPRSAVAFAAVFPPETLCAFQDISNNDAELLRFCDVATRNICHAGGMRIAWRALRCRVPKHGNGGNDAMAEVTWAVEFCVPAISAPTTTMTTTMSSTWEQDDVIVRGLFLRLVDAANAETGKLDGGGSEDGNDATAVAAMATAESPAV